MQLGDQGLGWVHVGRQDHYRLHHAADREPGRVRVRRQFRPEHHPRFRRLQRRIQGRRQELRRQHRGRGQPVGPEPRLTGRAPADPAEPRGHDPHHLDARDDEPGRGCLPGAGRAVPVDGRAVGIVVRRPWRQPADPTQEIPVHDDVLLRPEGVPGHLRADLEPRLHQQDRCLPVPERLGRQRLPRRFRAADQGERLHRPRRWRLHGPDHRLFRR